MTGTEINKWLHFTLDGKELYVSKVAIRNGISWDQLYSRGLVYGTNDNGRYPTGTPTNQYRTITLNGKLYKCRLLRGADADNIILTSGYDTLTSRNSEWSRIFYPIVTNDPYAKSYTGPKLASYTSGVLNMATGNGNQSWCQERPSNATTSRVLRGYASVANLLWIASSDVARTRGWRPVLELISD